jgi:1-acyl-sn-glycerol-3-phosphate acyltransferase
VVYKISRFLVWLLLRAAFGFRLEDGHREPASGPLIIVSNHVSDLDPLIVGASLRRRVQFMAKIELFRPPLLRWWITACGAFPVRRGEADRQALRTARTILERGGALVMFPEGTRASHLHDLRPPEPGAALLALRTGATILPIAVIGSDTVLPKGARRLARGTIRVRVGVPIRIDGTARAASAGRADRDRIETVGRRFMDAIARLLQGADTV